MFLLNQLNGKFIYTRKKFRSRPFFETECFFKTCSWRFLRSDILEQLEFKLKKTIGICRKCSKFFPKKNGKLKSKSRLCLLNHQIFLLFFSSFDIIGNAKGMRPDFSSLTKWKHHIFMARKAFAFFSGYLVQIRR